MKPQLQSKMRNILLVIVVATSVLVTVCASSIESPFITLKDLQAHTRDHRIISGTPATKGQFPWQVAIYASTQWGRSFCGGSLISQEWVLTAAHCAPQNTKSFTLYLGGITLNNYEQGRVKVVSTSAIVHEGYNDYLNNDVALIKLPKPVQITEYIRPIRLPQHGETLSANESVRVSGWGKTNDASNSVSNTLNWVDLKSIENERCSYVYGTQVVISSTICALGNPQHSTCNGDSGGPLVTFKEGVATQHGVVSFVHVNGCASGNPSGYVSTESMLDWIVEKTGLELF